MHIFSTRMVLSSED
uniref:Uncharacterized protein n=1 Tax=Rhizophora mucronata TaxID=61149 RepID=A0A2P2PE99_RHIMU